ncbi:glycosyltransferase family 4 protein [Chthonobacter albigriseus]|uniref:glycosyltransferase family 4 protein n=1 Tax=Chthonobacter albigriseus TaxID=1683161 RepID=UPI001FCEDF70|nr:glycosyltransferase family 4 protein [Chthonobacter albigriseus]
MLLGSLSSASDPAAPVPGFGGPRRILMTADAVGGVWRWAVDAAAGLNDRGIEVVLACLGPAPDGRHLADVRALSATSLIHVDEPLDWMAADEADLDGLAGRLPELVEALDIDLVHLNVPSQAVGLSLPCPVVVVAHSCVATWFRAVRGTEPPVAWAWQADRTRRGLLAADAVIAPSRSHAAAVEDVYGPLTNLRAVPNAVRWDVAPAEKRDFVFAAARWWDEGKNGRVLDRAAALSPWPVVMAGSLVSPAGTATVLNHAEAPGELPAAEVRSLMARAGIFVAPSVYEPFGLAPMEAAQAGCALVCADIPTFREIWDGAAIFADPHDPGRFAGAIARLAADPELRADFAGRARGRAEAYSPDAQIDGLVAVYAEVCRTGSLKHASAAE